MFNRKILKSRAKTVLASSYWQTLAILLLCSAASTIVGNLFSLKLPSVVTLSSAASAYLFGITVFMRSLLQFAANVFLVLPLQVSCNKYLLERANGGVPNVKILTYAFTDNYKGILCAVLAKQLILTAMVMIPVIAAGTASLYVLFRSGTGLSKLLSSANLEQIIVQLADSPEYAIISLVLLILMIPAIIKMYDYYLVEYILADNASIGWREALKKSKNLMRGNRFAAFLLNLSFIGWLMLGVLAFGIGTIFVTPYIEATNVQLYLELSGKSTYEQ